MRDQLGDPADDHERLQPPDDRVAGSQQAAERSALVAVRPEEPSGPTESDQLAYFGGGFKVALSPRIDFRAEINEYVVFTERDDNEEITEWKLGFAFSF